MLGGVTSAPESEVDQFNLIRNFSSEPVLSIQGSDVRTDVLTTIRYKHGGLGFPPTPYERAFLDIMYAHGISGTEVGGQKAGSQ